jgi:ADP-ribose pyrophosphatase YjhB (NUDIX family)
MSGAVRAVVAVAAIAFDEAGRVLLVRRGQPPDQSAWSVPGGKIEPGETVVAAVAREAAEETGLAVEVLGLVAAVDWIERGPDGQVLRHFVILDHLVAVRGGELAAGDDADEAAWFGPEELDGLHTTAHLLGVLEQARAMWRAMSPETAPSGGLATPPGVR